MKNATPVSRSPLHGSLKPAESGQIIVLLLMVLGLVGAVVLASGSLVKAIAMIVLP